MIDSARIRRELEGLLADQTQAVRDLAQTVADRASAAIAAGQPPSEVIARAVEGYDQALQDRISRDVTKAVCMGAGIWPEVAATGFVDQFSSQALVLSWDASQMPLSTRIHGTSVAMRAELDSAIRASISRRDGAWKQARRIYDGYGFGGIIHQDQLPGLPKDLDALVQASRTTLTPEGLSDLQARAKALKKYAASLRTAPLRAAYTQLLGNLEKGLSRGLERAIKTAAEEKARYHAERISRTETARAWGQGFMDQLDRDEDATGLRWETSSAHKIFDICDFHSRADLYGMGPGVYPLERRPRYPAHPHCLCVLSAVYKGKPRFDQVDKGGKAALDGMTPGQRARVLTIKGAEGFDRGGSWKGSLRHWQEPGPHQPSMGSSATLAAAVKAVEYVDKKTTKEAEAWARANNLADTISYKGLHVEVANRINETVQKHLQEFPDLRKGIQFLGSAQELNKEAKRRLALKGWSRPRIDGAVRPLGAYTMAFSVDAKHAQYEGVHGVGFNEKYFGPKYPEVKDALQKNSGVGKFHPPGKDPITDTVAHELGHQLDALYGLRKDSVVEELWKAALAKGVREEISGYALQRGITEGIAEGWGEAFAADSPRTFASGLRERILQLKKERK